MRGVINAACVTGLTLTAVGIASLWLSGLMGKDLAQAMLGLTSGPVLVLGTYAWSLARRITVLEAKLAAQTRPSEAA
ncbi:MAG: hypothetical protein KIT17_01025 [Rubrivivax sp.]|nr:hypothetical protein [Rubrivivax sp.]